MREMLLALCRHLRYRRYAVMREADIQVEVYDPTYGPRVSTQSIEVMDFDALITEIEEFAQSFTDNERNTDA